MRIRIIYSLHGAQQTGPDWPNKGFDLFRSWSRSTANWPSNVPSLNLSPPWPPAGTGQSNSGGGQGRAIDGYLVYQMNCWNQVVQTFDSGKPVLYADFQFGGSGGFLVYTAGFLRSKAPNVGFVASSQIEDLVEAVKCFALAKKGRSASDFVAATAQASDARTPEAGRPQCKPDQLQLLSTGRMPRPHEASKILALRGQESAPAERSWASRLSKCRSRNSTTPGSGRQGPGPSGGGPLAEKCRRR